MTLRELESVIMALSPAEKTQVLQWVARDLTASSAGIEHQPEVMGGAACVVRTRIPVWLLVQLRRQGMSESDLLANYPILRAEDLCNAWAYAHNHLDEIEAEILAQIEA